MVLDQIQLMLDYLYAFEDDFVKTLMDKSSKDKKKKLSTKKKKIDTNNKRIAELDDIFKRLYEDNLSGKIKIHAPMKENGQRIQRIDIYYTAVGVIDIPQHFQEFAI